MSCHPVRSNISDNVFSRLSTSDLYRSGLVCKEWRDYSSKPMFWIPTFNELNPLAQRKITTDETRNIKSEVLKPLQAVYEILSLINTDGQLAFCINTPLPSPKDLEKIPRDERLNYVKNLLKIPLKDLRKTPLIERTRYITEYLKKDCTQLLIFLLTKYHTDKINAIRNAALYTGCPPDQNLLQENLLNFYSEDRSLPCFVNLIENPLGPRDDQTIVYTLLRAPNSLSKQGFPVDALATVLDVMNRHANKQQ